MAVSNRLSEQDNALFYRIFLALLSYQNSKSNTFPDFEKDMEKGMIKPEEAYELCEGVFENPTGIDEYLEECGGSLSEEETEILRSWKNFRKDRFIVERFLKSGAAFIDSRENVYLVKGLTTSVEDAFCGQCPVITTTVLLPFGNQIISTGLYASMPLSFGGGMKKMFKDSYSKAKKTGKYYTSMPEKEE